MPMRPRAIKVFKLHCNHMVEVCVPYPSVGDEQHCSRCHRYNVIVLEVLNWTTTCKRSCAAGTRSFYADKDKAFNYARKHVQRWCTHTMVVWCDGRKKAEVTNVGEDLFSTIDEARSLVRSVQSVESGTTIQQGEFPF